MAKKTKQRVHLICNAHLDPVWLWQWEEGAAEAISTFRTAADLAENDGAFIFNHNEVTLYKWVQEYEPSLFARIQALAKAGRWHIMGGWYLQPDCNMPSGESFVRQILLGKSYFKEHFGVEPSTAINFDPFGHTRGLVQILAKSGYDSYLFGRPRPHEFELPSEDFVWVGYDGSEVMATRFCGWYNTFLGRAAGEIAQRIADNPHRRPVAILWGIGDHGGGPSKIDLQAVNDLIKQDEEHEIRHSTPEDFFADFRRNGAVDQMGRVERDLNPWAVGCYTSQIQIKQAHRRLENEVYLLEKMASAAAFQGLMKYPADEIGAALCDLMVGEFHDVLPGSSIEAVESDALRQFAHGLEIASRAKARAFFALTSGQRQTRDGRIPVMVYNPHPFAVRATVECEFNLADFKLDEGYMWVDIEGPQGRVPTQVEVEKSAHGQEWRKRAVFQAELAPAQMNRFDAVLTELPARPRPQLQPEDGLIALHTDELDVAINTHTGLIERYVVEGRPCLAPGAGQLLVVQDNEDPWGMFVTRFDEVVGRFELMSPEAGAAFSGSCDAVLPSVRVIEDGPVRAVVEAVFQYDHSFVAQRYVLPKQGTEIGLQTRVYWNEKCRMLKLALPTGMAATRYRGQVAYGVDDLPSDGAEAVAQKWTAAVSEADDFALACINDGIYGSSFADGEMRLTLLRSPVYSAHPDRQAQFKVPQDRYVPRIDQGRRYYEFWLRGGRVETVCPTLDRVALAHNEKPVALSFFPPGLGSKPKPFLTLSDDVVQVTAIKRAEKGKDLIVRLYEPTGTPRETTVALPWAKRKRKVKLGPFEIKTLRFSSKQGEFQEVNLLERKVKAKAPRK